MINPTRDLHPKHLGNMLFVEETLNFDGNKIKNDLLVLKCECRTETEAMWRSRNRKIFKQTQHEIFCAFEMEIILHIPAHVFLKIIMKHFKTIYL